MDSCDTEILLVSFCWAAIAKNRLALMSLPTPIGSSLLSWPLRHHRLIPKTLSNALGPSFTDSKIGCYYLGMRVTSENNESFMSSF